MAMLDAKITQYLTVTALLLGLFACASTPKPVNNREPGSTSRSTEVTYSVRRGDTLFSLARRFFVPLTALQQRNQLDDSDRLDVGQQLLVPRGTTGFNWPLTALSVSSEFGARGARHRGIDLRAAPGTPVRASADGRVVFAGAQNRFGNVVILQHTNGVQTLYAHNRRNHVGVGAWVRRGQTIAAVGKSGNATGYHVHFEFILAGRKVNPRHYVG